MLRRESYESDFVHSTRCFVPNNLTIKGTLIRGRAAGILGIMDDQNYHKQTKTAEELQAMILDDLMKVAGCPEKGVNITVYGMPWKAMMMFGVAAGPVRNKAELQRFLEIITERLQRLYDLAWP